MRGRGRRGVALSAEGAHEYAARVGLGFGSGLGSGAEEAYKDAALREDGHAVVAILGHKDLR